MDEPLETIVREMSEVVEEKELLIEIFLLVDMMPCPDFDAAGNDDESYQFFYPH